MEYGYNDAKVFLNSTYGTTPSYLKEKWFTSLPVDMESHFVIETLNKLIIANKKDIIFSNNTSTISGIGVDVFIHGQKIEGIISIINNTDANKIIFTDTKNNWKDLL